MKKVVFRCPACNRQMGADALFEGRVISCPVCGQPLVIPGISGGVAEPALDSVFADDEETGSPPDPGQETRTWQPGADETSASVPFSLPQPDPDDPMCRVFPAFVPNPFAVSYPLDAVSPDNHDAEDEDDAPVDRSKMPSVEELINGS